jgi:hypothetical protein
MKTGNELVCDAFPEGIPADIISGQIRHTSAVSGDQGIRFENKTFGPEYFIAGDCSLEILFRITAAGDCERYVPILDIWEPDNEFLSEILAEEDMYRSIDSYEAEVFLEREQVNRDAMNPCALHIRQMMYLQSRESRQD